MLLWKCCEAVLRLCNSNLRPSIVLFDMFLLKRVAFEIIHELCELMLIFLRASSPFHDCDVSQVVQKFAYPICKNLKKLLMQVCASIVINCLRSAT